MMMEKGFSSLRHDAFPAGLRVLVVDDDPTWLKILEKMLKKCSYDVTTCGLAREALKLLRERKDGYDIVISDVNMPDMDGFKLLEHVGLEMDLPVIMMSVDGETSRVMKGVQHGACDYLLKPIRMKELRNIWQHVFRKRIHEIRDIEGLEGLDGIHMTRSGLEHSDDGHLLGGEEVSFGKKRKDLENKHDDRDPSDPSSAKKARVVWSVELHQKFVNAVNLIGFDKVGPKKILDLMNVPWLTRENVASHLQKYRLFLSRLQKENELKSSLGGIKHSDSPPKDGGAGGSSSPDKTSHNEAPTSSYGFSGSNSLVQIANANKNEVDQKGSGNERSQTVNLPSPRKVKTRQTGLDHSLGSLGSEVSFSAFSSSSLPTQYAWSEVSEVQSNLDQKPLLFDDGISQLPLSSQHPFIMNSGPSLAEKDVKPSYDNGRSNQVTPGSANDFLLPQGKSCTAPRPGFDLPSMKIQNFNTSIPDETNFAPGNLVRGTESPFPASLDDDFQLHWLQGDYLPANLSLQNVDFAGFYNQGLVSEFPVHLCDAVRYDFEHFSDPNEYAFVEQGLFIV